MIDFWIFTGPNLIVLFIMAIGGYLIAHLRVWGKFLAAKYPLIALFQSKWLEGAVSALYCCLFYYLAAFFILLECNSHGIKASSRAIMAGDFSCETANYVLVITGIFFHLLGVAFPLSRHKADTYIPYIWLPLFFLLALISGYFTIFFLTAPLFITLMLIGIMPAAIYNRRQLLKRK